MDYEIAPEELKSLRDGNSDVVVVDVREDWEFQTASIADSLHIPMNEIPARFPREVDHEKHVVVICHHGVRSMNVTMWLRQQGVERVQSLQGGIDRWSREVDASVPLY
jgi:rhodanese-related sulfurtransferase